MYVDTFTVMIIHGAPSQFNCMDLPTCYVINIEMTGCEPLQVVVLFCFVVVFFFWKNSSTLARNFFEQLVLSLF